MMALVFDPYETVENSKTIVCRPPGLVYDMKMAEYDCPWDKTYPEGPARYVSVFNRLEELGLLSKMTQIHSRKASEEEILKCHERDSFVALKETEDCMDFEDLEEKSSRYDAIYLHPKAYEAALLAAGSTIELVDQICNDKLGSGFALVRPPGHHAMRNEFCGYCYFNNAALAAQHALDKYDVKKILIVDWDVHHGQATQQMFYDDNRVLYFSIHRYEHGTFWPNLRESDFDHVGEGVGAGYNVNVPLNKTGMTNTDYMAIFHSLLLPLASEYQPELIIISAGFDAAVGCPEGEMLITPACYAHLLWSLKNLAYGKLAVVLEGGYCLKSLAEGAALTVRALIGEPCPLIGALGTPCPEVVETINDVIHAHQSYWWCFMKPKKEKNRVEMEQHTAEIEHCPVVKYLHTEEKPTSYATRNCYPVQTKEFLLNVDLMLDSLRESTQLSFAPNKVCFVYDSDMMLHDPVQNSKTKHPEDPQRIAHAFKKFHDFNLIPRCKRLESRIITKTELEMVHEEGYLKLLKDVSESTPEKQREVERDYNSVTFCRHSFDSACLAAGCLLQVVDEVMTGQSQSGVAIIRPPGHHAYPDTPHGFCLLNNVAIAAKYAQNKFNLKRILILDWDVHHGNGTQDIFYDNPNVLYISLHVYAEKKFFPYLECSSASFVGTGNGKGFNVNIPWNQFGVENTDYLAAFYAVVMPIAYQFDPELVIVSAGFDAAVNDNIGMCKVTPEAYGHMTHYVSALANGKVVLALEGGYNKESLATSLASCTKTLLGDPVPFMDTVCKGTREAKTIKHVVEIQRKYWSCLQLKTTVADLAKIPDSSDIGLVPVSPVGENPPTPPDFREIVSSLSTLDTDDTSQEQTCSTDVSVAGELQENSTSPCSSTHVQFQALSLLCDLDKFVEKYPAGKKDFSLEKLEAAHAACLEEPLPAKMALSFSCDVSAFVERYPAGQKEFSLEKLEAVHAAYLENPMSPAMGRPCGVGDVVNMSDEGNGASCTTLICNQICTWRCVNCCLEFCGSCKKSHAE